MSNDPTSGQGWYVPPSGSGLQPAPPPAAAPSVPTPPPAPAVPLQPGGYGAVAPYGSPPGYGAAPVQQAWAGSYPGSSYGSAPWAPPARLASPGGRLGALLLDAVLCVFTLVIGWAVWSLVVWGRGTTPGKSLLGQRVVDAGTGATATWGHMFVRQVLVGGLLAWLLGSITLGIWYVVDACMVFSDGHRRLTDRISSTLVVQD